jgi:hypothetical protein
MSGALRVKKPDALRKEGGKSVGGDEYLGRLTKLIPSEALAVYLTGREHARDWLGWWAAICALLVIALRGWGTTEKGRGPQWPAVAIALISFVIWVYAMGDYLLGWKIAVAGLASNAVLVWVVIAPILYKGS